MMSLSHSHILGGERVDEYFKGKASLHKFKIEGQWVSHITLAGNLRSVHAFSYISCQIFEMRACVKFQNNMVNLRKACQCIICLFRPRSLPSKYEFWWISAEISGFIQGCCLHENSQ